MGNLGNKYSLIDQAKALYETESRMWTGIAWDWDKASEEVKRRFLLMVEGGHIPFGTLRPKDWPAFETKEGMG